MKASQIIDNYIDMDKIKIEFLRDIEAALIRQDNVTHHEMFYALYGNEKEDLELEQLRADLYKTQAESEKIVNSQLE